MNKLHLLFVALMACTISLQAQQLSQTVKGQIVDAESNSPLIGANVAVLTLNPVRGASTDLDGYFKIEDVPVGRHDLQITYLGYETASAKSVLVTSGKEVVLNIGLQEATINMGEIVVKASEQVDKSNALNEFATVSSRTFSIEETSRYAAASFDPARMAQNYAGVSVGSTFDLFNEIVIRGNSPSGVLWRLEGVEIPNPNHFGAMGSSGGAISMLSSSTLSNSDFYTGAFPSEFGNALSGVFDLKMRNGNNEKREYSLMVGALGVEASLEGPFSKKSKASYLFNYRYSTLALLQAIALSPTGDVLPTYQDLSFKVNVPTEKAGTFSIFGLGGTNLAAYVPEKDSLQWEFFDENEGFGEQTEMGTVGLSHKILLGKTSYLRTVAIGSYERARYREYYLNDSYDEKPIEDDENKQVTYRLSSMYHNKLNARNSFRLGVIASHMKFNFHYDNVNQDNGEETRYFENEAKNQLIQAYFQWKHRLGPDWTLNGGLHYSLMTLNNKMSIEPRVAASWQVSPKHRLSVSAGLHSKMEHLAMYSFEGSFADGTIVESKKHLGFTKAFHGVLGYDYFIHKNWRMKVEAYYQYLYDVPVSDSPASNLSILNASSIWDYIDVKNAEPTGTGTNIGIDFTLEKFFSNQYYFMATASLYDSKFTAKNGNTYSTRFNGNYQLNLIGGKEFKVGKKKNNIIGINAKMPIAGGARYTPVNVEESLAQEETILYRDRLNESRSSAYLRLDIGFSYKLNTKRVTHAILFDIQNVTNRENTHSLFYNPYTNSIEQDTQLGIFPFFNYRLEF